MATKTIDQILHDKHLRDDLFHEMDGNGNGGLSLAEIDGYVKDKYPGEFEAHALYNRDHAPLRAFDVLLPWLLQGCERPPKVKVLRYYGTPNSVHFGGKPQMEQRIRSWTAVVEPESWCESCTLLDKMVEPSLGDVANA